MNRRRNKRETGKKRYSSFILSLGVVGGLTGALLLMGVGMSGARTREWIEISSPEEWEQYLLDEDSPDYDLGGRYRLTEDLDLTGCSWSIGTNYHPFTGMIDGAGHVVEGLDRPMFGVTKGARIENLLIDQCTIQYPYTYYDGEEAVDGYAALIAYAVDTDIKSCGTVGEMYIDAPQRAMLVLDSDYTVTATPSEAGKATPSNVESKADSEQNPEETVEETSPSLPETSESGEAGVEPTDSPVEETETPDETAEQKPDKPEAGTSEEPSKPDDSSAVEKETANAPEKEHETEKQSESGLDKAESHRVDDALIPLADHPVRSKGEGTGLFYAMGRMESSVVSVASIGGGSSGIEGGSGSGSGSSTGGNSGEEGGSGSGGGFSTGGSSSEEGGSGSGSGSSTGGNSGEESGSGSGGGSGTGNDSGNEGGSSTEDSANEESGTGSGDSSNEENGTGNGDGSSEEGGSGSNDGSGTEDDSNHTDGNTPSPVQPESPDSEDGKTDITDSPSDKEEGTNPPEATEPEQKPTDATPPEEEETDDSQTGHGGAGGGNKPNPAEPIPEETLPVETEPETEKKTDDEDDAYYVEVTAQRIVAGGLVAQVDGKSLITECFSFMDIGGEEADTLEAEVLSAGFCGRIGEDSRVESSYASGLLDIGGMSAGFAGVNAGKLQDCFTTSIMGEHCEDTYAFVGRNLEEKGSLNGCIYDRQIACTQDDQATGQNTVQIIGDESGLSGESWYYTENAYPQIAYFANHENEIFRLRSSASAIALVLPEDITLSDALKAAENGLDLPAEIDGEEIRWSAEGAVSITDDNRAVFNASGSKAMELPDEETGEADDDMQELEEPEDGIEETEAPALDEDHTDIATPPEAAEPAE